MIGVVLAGGKGTRLYPITRYVNKHILPIGNKPMIYYPIKTLVDSGVNKIVIVISQPFGSQVKQVVQELDLRGVQLLFAVQKKPLGMPDGILSCAEFVKGDSMVVIAGDNLYGGHFKNEIGNFKSGALSFLRKVDDARRFGVAAYDVDGNLMGLIEKPENFKCKWAVSGPHLFDNQVFELIKKLKFSSRGELEITDLNSEYAKIGQLKLIKRADLWQDMGTFESLANSSYEALKVK